jgi:peptidoglycan/xylan/chitin deacetylase (PgdA/CDA1 family)
MRAVQGEELARRADRASAELHAANAAAVRLDVREHERLAKELARAGTADLRSTGRTIRALCAENAALGGGEGPPPGPRHARTPRHVPWRPLLLAAGAIVLLAGGVAVAAQAAAPSLELTGPPTHVVGLDALPALSFAADEGDADWTLDGRRVRPERSGGSWVYRPKQLSDGAHTLVVTRKGRLFSAARRSFRFTVDTTPPILRLAQPAVVRIGEPLIVHGSLEAGATLKRGTIAVAIDGDGAFVLRSGSPPPCFELLATDAAGNRSRWSVPVTVAPRRPKEPVRSVHVTAYGWANDELRNGVLALVKAGRINTIELDVKDESGEMGFNPQIPRARQIKAALPIYDLAKTVAELHARGVRVIGRLVCFRDPILAAASWKAGRRDEVIQTPGGEPYAGYGGFTNFANPAVRKYNIDVAVAAAKAGIDEILYDYVRRPDGPLDSMVFPGLKGTPEDGIVRFLTESRAALAGTGTLIGASVFGVAATRPTEVAQDIPKMAREVDYIAPMVYPSHWGPGEYDVGDPNGEPYEIVRRSTEDFVKQVRGTGARIVPWLQDFSLGRSYGPDEVRAQIRAARDAGADEFILWDAAVSYTADGLDTTAALPATGISTKMPKDAPGPVRLPLPKRRPTEARAAAAEPVESTQPLPGLAPNELGQVPVVMHHMIRADRVGDYDQTPKEFRAELEYLWKRGYAPVNAGDLATGKLDVPRGLTPIAFTFDDATTYQIQLDRKGQVVPQTAVGIMLDFARTHPGFRPAGTFYVNRTPFGSAAQAPKVMRWLVGHGFEIGNHTHDHLPLRTLSAADVRRQLATGAEVIEQALTGYEIRTLALPLGSMPHDASLAVRGSWRGTSYGPYAVLLVGANPAPSPYSKAFDPTAIPRIRSSHLPWPDEDDYAFGFWMRKLEQSPKSRFVSDGDPATIAVRADGESALAPRYAARADVAASR